MPGGLVVGDPRRVGGVGGLGDRDRGLAAVVQRPFVARAGARAAEGTPGCPGAPASSRAGGSTSSHRSRATSSRLSRLQTPRRSRLRSISASARARSARASTNSTPPPSAWARVRTPCDAASARERRGGRAAAAQDHQRDQARLGDQRAGGAAVGRAHELDRAGLEARLGERRRDDPVDQGHGRAQGRRAGPQHPAVARFHELGGDVHRHVRPGLVVGAHHAHRAPALPHHQASPQSARPGRLLDVGELGQGVDLSRHAAEARVVQPQPVDQGIPQTVPAGGLDVGGVRLAYVLGPLDEQARHRPQGGGHRPRIRADQTLVSAAGSESGGGDELRRGVAHAPDRPLVTRARPAGLPSRRGRRPP